MVLCHYVHCWFLQCSTVCQYLTMYHILVLCHCVQCCFLQPVHGVSVLYTVPFLVLCHYVQCWLLQTVYCLPVLNTVLFVYSLSLCTLLSPTVFTLFVRTLHCTICWFRVSGSTAYLYSLYNVYQYITSTVSSFYVTVTSAFFYSLSPVCR